MATEGVQLPTITFGSRLRALRDAQKLTRFQLALKTGGAVSPATIQKLETDADHLPNLRTGKHLANALGVALSELIEGTEVA